MKMEEEVKTGELIKHTIYTFDNYLNNKKEGNIYDVTERLRETLRFKNHKFNTPDIISFVSLFAENTIGELFGETEDVPEYILGLTILNKRWKFNNEVISSLHNIFEHEENQRNIIFSNFMLLVNEVSQYSKQLSRTVDYGQKLYNLIRMEFLVKRPIVKRIEFEKDIKKCLSPLAGGESKKLDYFLDKAYKLFDSFYTELNVDNPDSTYICSNCNYIKNEEMSNKYHYFCGDSSVVRYSNKFKDKARRYIVKKEVYEFYTQPGLIERDTYEALKHSKYKVNLYPDIEKSGDIEVVLNNKSYYLDAKTTKDNVVDLSKELEKVKYKNRIIVLPDNKYFYIKEFLLKENPDLKVFNIEDLLKYFGDIK